MRNVRVQCAVTVPCFLALGLLLASSASYAQEENISTRTIIEQLDDPVSHANSEKRSPAPPAQHAKADYDYSVISEELPAIPGVVSMEAPGEAGWVTIVEARAINASAAPPASVNGFATWLAALMVLAGMVALLWTRLPKLATLGRSIKVASPLQFDWLSQVGPTIYRFAERAGKSMARHRSDQPAMSRESDAAQPEQAINHGLQQVNGLFCQVEQIVFELQHGSPLRDALQQELRLIAHRIDTTRASAVSGEETLERLQGRCRVLSRELDRVRRIAESAAASVRDPRDRLAIPQTQSEAYALLGVNPDATAPVLKKLVDALRMNWHPDHARDESDRLLREERIKQINIAWDLITTDAHG
jgi:DnaJ-domain-containing protein 1